jgi:N-acetyl-anhydromuramyl-L-alanine amidase AmpD
VTYETLPPVGSLGVPDLAWRPSANLSSRNGRQAEIVFVHVWGGGSFDGVVDWLSNPSSQASAHVVYAGETGPDAKKAAQLVPWAEKAWTECDFNSIGLSIESADAIWQGHDPAGFARLARIVALLCDLHGFPARWVQGDALLHGSAKGFARHADGGRLACGHYYCPTQDLALWRQFVERVTLEFRHGEFRPKWGR